MKINFKKWLAGILLLCVSASLLGCGSRQIVLARSRLLMGHVPVNLQIRTQREQKERALAASEGAYQEAARLEGLLSEYQQDSEISCLNRRAGKGHCHLSPETLELLQRAIAYSEQTEGAFDIRFSSLSAKGRSGKIEIQERLGEGLLRDAETRLGLGAIAKGYIVEAMSAYLKGQGFPDHLINAGGDLAARGGFWEVALQVPGGAPGQFVDERKMKDQVVSSSGNYEQGTHILDPRSGQKVEHSGGVTVIGTDLTKTDAVTTAFFVLGKTETERILKKFSDLEVIWLDAPTHRP